MHYKNGREAKVGDMVVGKTYNVPHLVAGTLLSVTPGPDACSATVGFLFTVPVKDFKVSMLGYGQSVVRVMGAEQHGSAGEMMVAVFQTDSTECKNLMHADDANKAAEAYFMGKQEAAV